MCGSYKYEEGCSGAGNIAPIFTLMVALTAALKFYF